MLELHEDEHLHIEETVLSVPEETQLRIEETAFPMTEHSNNVEETALPTMSVILRSNLTIRDSNHIFPHFPILEIHNDLS